MLRDILLHPIRARLTMLASLGHLGSELDPSGHWTQHVFLVDADIGY